MNTFKATKNDEGRTLLKFLNSLLIDVPKSKIERMFRNKDIKVNGKRTRDKKYIISEGDEIIVFGVRFSPKTFDKVKPTFEVIYEDENILVINKPETIVMHDDKNSLDTQVLTYLNFVKVDSFTPSHIGRLDKVTSGVVLYGKNYETVRMLKENSSFFIKTYRAQSDLKDDTTLRAYIYHDENLQKEVVTDNQSGKVVKTSFLVLGRGEIEATLHTGRKHQIRASLEFLKAPIKGDKKYGGSKAERVYLHSYRLVLNGLSGNLEYLNNKEFISHPY